eukprot:scaffold48935_cov45-Phaeocystis_antarctica.AAC.1
MLALQTYATQGSNPGRAEGPQAGLPLTRAALALGSGAKKVVDPNPNLNPNPNPNPNPNQWRQEGGGCAAARERSTATGAHGSSAGDPLCGRSAA